MESAFFVSSKFPEIWSSFLQGGGVKISAWFAHNFLIVPSWNFLVALFLIQYVDFLLKTKPNFILWNFCLDLFLLFGFIKPSIVIFSHSNQTEKMLNNNLKYELRVWGVSII